MKKVLAGLIIAGLLLLGKGSCLAAEVSIPETTIPELQIPEITLEQAGADIKTAIERQPIDFVAYIGYAIDYAKVILARLLESGKPALLFNGKEIKTGIEITLLENFLIRNLDLVGGLILNGSEEEILEGWKDRLYGGLEYPISLLGGQNIFARLKMGGYGTKEGFCFGLGFEL